MTDIAALIAELRAPATDIVERNDLRARAADAIEGMREALAGARTSIVCAIAFLNRDLGTDRALRTTPQVVKELALTDAAIRAALALPDSKPDRGGA